MYRIASPYHTFIGIIHIFCYWTQRISFLQTISLTSLPCKYAIIKNVYSIFICYNYRTVISGRDNSHINQTLKTSTFCQIEII